jgi:hypothetical protein
MTAHELAKALLEMPDVEVVYEDDYYGEQTVGGAQIKLKDSEIVVELRPVV